MLVASAVAYTHAILLQLLQPLFRCCCSVFLPGCEGERRYRTLISLLGLLATMRRVVNYHSSRERQRHVMLFDASGIRPSFIVRSGQRRDASTSAHPSKQQRPANSAQRRLHGAQRLGQDALRVARRRNTSVCFAAQRELHQRRMSSCESGAGTSHRRPASCATVAPRASTSVRTPRAVIARLSRQPARSCACERGAAAQGCGDRPEFRKILMIQSEIQRLDTIWQISYDQIRATMALIPLLGIRIRTPAGSGRTINFNRDAINTNNNNQCINIHRVFQACYLAGTCAWLQPVFQEPGASRLIAVVTSIRSTTRFETPSSDCTRSPDEISTIGFST
ncbi:hypothetical protein F511_04608 [Dorcoceras hygrometricum]|uniref:Uncharacterized protein n=1 Tax=Dorcoceras hygrometricum TaxID=472368 RepID=A0A2Z7BGK8_9LAMI|nr:hypothetical protein F511_04608 [Dorcoceras hygrometricum]